MQQGGPWWRRGTRGTRVRVAAPAVRPLLAPGDGWAAEAAPAWAGAEEISALRRVLEPDLGARPAQAPWWLGHVRALTQRENRAAYAALRTLFEALGTAVPRTARRADADADADADGRPLLVCHANTAAAVNTVWAAAELLGERATETLGLILERTLAEPWAVESGRLRNACTRALIGLDTPRATDLLVGAAAGAASKTQKEQLLLCLDLAKHAGERSPSRLAELHVPDHGLSAGGRLPLHTHHREYLLILEPDGRVAVQDRTADATPDQAAQRVLDAQARAIRATYRRERIRIEALLAAERVWGRDEWQRVYQVNPITRAVAARLVWRHERVDGRVLEVMPDAGDGIAWVRAADGACRPSVGDEVHVPGTAVTLWHPRDADSAALAAWRALREARGLVQPFAQIGRDFTRVEPDPDATELNQHASSRVEAAAFADAVSRLDWHSRRTRSGRSGDALRVVYRDFPDALLSVSVTCREEQDTVELGPGCFHRAGDRARTPLALGYVPPRVYSEALRDIAVLARGAVPGETDVHDRVGP